MHLFYARTECDSIPSSVNPWEIIRKENGLTTGGYMWRHSTTDGSETGSSSTSEWGASAFCGKAIALEQLADYERMSSFQRQGLSSNFQSSFRGSKFEVYVHVKRGISCQTPDIQTFAEKGFGPPTIYRSNIVHFRRYDWMSRENYIW